MVQSVSQLLFDSFYATYVFIFLSQSPSQYYNFEDNNVTDTQESVCVFTQYADMNVDLHCLSLDTNACLCGLT